MLNISILSATEPTPKEHISVIPLRGPDDDKQLDSHGLISQALILKLKNFETLRVVVGERQFFVIQTPASPDAHGLKQIGGLIARAGLDQDFSLDLSEYTVSELGHIFTGLTGGGYSFRRYKSEKQPKGTQNCVVRVAPNLLTEAEPLLRKARTVASRIDLARDLANTPANHLGPQDFAEIAAAMAAEGRLECEIWDEPRLTAEKCGALLAVGQGSAKAPRLVRLRYGSGRPLLTLVGKGITFDTGGLSIKPADGMLGMKYDMSGAAVALAAVLAIADLKLNVCVEAIMVMAENMPGPNATRPGDIVSSRSGKTIEVTNTDAEGRLVLADGISVALDANPEHLIDIATLTGAATIALGTRYAGIMGTGNTPDLLLSAANSVAERFWRMPLPEDSRRLLDTSSADIMNAKVGSRAGGMLVGAQFLNEFVNFPEAPARNWAHLDIANVASNDSAPYEEHPSGSTAYGVRSIVALAESLSQSK